MGLPDVRRHGATAMNVVDVANTVIEAADHLGQLERERDVEFLRLVAQGDTTYLAQRKVDVEFGPRIRRAQAAYEVVLEALRRA